MYYWKYEAYCADYSSYLVLWTVTPAKIRLKIEFLPSCPVILRHGGRVWRIGQIVSVNGEWESEILNSQNPIVGTVIVRQ